MTTIWGTTNKPISSQRLAKALEGFVESDSFLYIGYPIIASPDGAFPIDALLVSRAKGIVIFNLVEGRDLNGYKAAQDESANLLETKLRSHKGLMQGRTLLAAPFVITYAPIAKIRQAGDPKYPLCNDDNLLQTIEDITWAHPTAYENAISVIQSISTIRKGRKRRDVSRPGSRGFKLKGLEDSIANLDNLQGQAVIETVAGVQRIRGLAGSGKTLILALKAAYLHAQHPNWKIAVTFNTRSLKEQFRRLINTFTIEQTNEETDWERISVLNAWGGPGGPAKNGIYYNFCRAHGIDYYDFQRARSDFGGSDRAFEGACDAALKQATEVKPLYDAILIDEAQDFAASFLRLCYAMLDTNKRLVYAYDELQSLSEKSLPPPEELFGSDANGKPVVEFHSQAGMPKQDIILEKCYRNSRPILASAHALGFGLYRRKDPKTKTGLVQMFDRKELWLDVGYVVADGSLQEGEEVRLARTRETSRSSWKATLLRRTSFSFMSSILAKSRPAG